MILTDDDNNGLAGCLVDFGFTRVYRDFCTHTSIADFAIIAANALTGHLSNNHDDFDLGA